MDNQRKLSDTISNIMHSTIRNNINVKQKIHIYFKVSGHATPIPTSGECNYFYMKSILGKVDKIMHRLFTFCLVTIEVMYGCAFIVFGVVSFKANTEFYILSSHVLWLMILVLWTIKSNHYPQKKMDGIVLC